MKTLSEIASDVRRLAPEHIDALDLAILHRNDGGYVPESSARLALVGAMVLACNPSRDDVSWTVWCWVGENDGRSEVFEDKDHGNDPLRSLHAAFIWACNA